MKHSTFFVLFFLFTTALLVTSCNTVRGFGEDISGSATWTQRKMTGEDNNNNYQGPSQNPPQWPKN